MKRRERAHPRADLPPAARGRADALGGKQITDVAKSLEVSEQTFHRWRNTVSVQAVEGDTRASGAIPEHPTSIPGAADGQALDSAPRSGQ